MCRTSLLMDGRTLLYSLGIAVPVFLCGYVGIRGRTHVETFPIVSCSNSEQAKFSAYIEPVAGVDRIRNRASRASIEEIRNESISWVSLKEQGKLQALPDVGANDSNPDSIRAKIRGSCEYLASSLSFNAQKQLESGCVATAETDLLLSLKLTELLKNSDLTCFSSACRRQISTLNLVLHHKGSLGAGCKEQVLAFLAKVKMKTMVSEVLQLARKQSIVLWSSLNDEEGPQIQTSLVLASFEAIKKGSRPEMDFPGAEELLEQMQIAYLQSERLNRLTDSLRTALTNAGTS